MTLFLSYESVTVAFILKQPEKFCKEKYTPPNYIMTVWPMQGALSTTHIHFIYTIIPCMFSSGILIYWVVMYQYIALNNCSKISRFYNTLETLLYLGVGSEADGSPLPGVRESVGKINLNTFSYFKLRSLYTAT